MKKLIIMSALVMGGLGLKTADAQFGIHINLHLGARPVYVPAQPAEVEDQPVYNDDYYYLPEVEAYYSVAEHSYYYQDGDRWVSAAFLPGRYHSFDWRYAKHYEIHADRPYMHNEVYRGKFGGFENHNDYYARAYPNRGDYNNGYRGHEQYDNRGWNDQNRGGFDRPNDHNQNRDNQPQDYKRDGYNQPSQNGYNFQNSGHNQGSFNGNSQGSNYQPSQGLQQGSRGNAQGQKHGSGNNQPANHSDGQNNGSYTRSDHYAANKMGVAQDRPEFARPIRN